MCGKYLEILALRRYYRKYLRNILQCVNFFAKNAEKNMKILALRKYYCKYLWKFLRCAKFFAKIYENKSENNLNFLYDGMPVNRLSTFNAQIGKYWFRLSGANLENIIFLVFHDDAQC